MITDTEARTLAHSILEAKIDYFLKHTESPHALTFYHDLSQREKDIVFIHLLVDAGSQLAQFYKNSKK